MVIFDVEADGLLNEATKIHCLSYNKGGVIKTLTSYSDMREFLKEEQTLIGHNIIRYDIPLLEKILRVKIKARLIDTLAISWYINTNNTLHGLEFFGKKYGVLKPHIESWEDQTLSEYIHRCEEDVKINTLLWEDMYEELLDIYSGKKSEVSRIVDYLSFKMSCARSAEEHPIKIDLDRVNKNIEELESRQQVKVNALSKVMPNLPTYIYKERPKKPFKKDGSLSSLGEKWFNLLEKLGQPEDFSGVIKIRSGWKPPNPNSPDQVKNWLFSLGWKPCTFKYDGDRKIPQIRDSGFLTPSVLSLIDSKPEIKHLEELSVIQHRLGIFKGFLEHNRGGYIIAPIGGFTNTLRFKHKKPLVNLPKVDKPWGEEIRGCLIAPEGYVLCGADMVSLEDTTKRHYMYDYDPEYVKEMSMEGFDPHLDLAKHAGVITEEDIALYNKGVEEVVKRLKPLRSKYKVANYSCVYGVGASKLSLSSGLSFEEAEKLKNSYWNRNWAVKESVKPLETKEIRGKVWLLNPVSGFYYSLRYEKDKFSTLNQGTGVYCFDSWIYYWKDKTRPLSGQWHDEVLFYVKKGEEKNTIYPLKTAIKRLNNRLKLNVDLDVDIKFGNNYAEVH